ncbi:MAG TPA: TetR/AcrR family transcriptional regulator [Lactobacillus sp.]|nr:TetR/AcrR family transcriptional regulator [Lactobacillus sp.]
MLKPKRGGCVPQDTKEKNTETALKKAFIKLVATKTFRKMTIRDIATTAHVSRGTFYLHYVDKYAMLTAYEDQLITGIKQIFAKYSKPSVYDGQDDEDNAFYHMFVYLNREKQLVQTLYQIPESVIIRRMMVLITVEVASESVDENLSTQKNEIPLEYARAILVQNILGIITQWIRKDQPESAHEIVKIFMDSRSLSPIDLATFVQSDKRTGLNSTD